MRTISKIFLVIAAILWVLSYTFLDDQLHGVFKPAAVIFVMLTFISNLIPDQEYRQFRDDHRTREEAVEGERTKKRHRFRFPHTTRVEHAR